MKSSMLVLAASALYGIISAAGAVVRHQQRQGDHDTRFLGAPATKNSTVVPAAKASQEKKASSEAKKISTSVPSKEAQLEKKVSSDAKKISTSVPSKEAPLEKKASGDAKKVSSSAPSKVPEKSKAMSGNATENSKAKPVPHLLASFDKPLVAEVDKFLRFFTSSPKGLDFNYEAFKEQYPTKADFVPPCLAHVHRLVNKVDRSYTDVQLGTVLENECWMMKHFQYVVVDEYRQKKDCKQAAKDLVAAREEELSSGKITGYTQFCDNYYEFQKAAHEVAAPVPKSDAALQRIPFFLAIVAVMHFVHMF